MRVIVAARLSVLAEGQTGLDSQEQEVIRWAQQQGHKVVGVAADFKTGKSALWDRPNLRPWVTDPAKISQYDAIVAYKVDRLTRADDEGVSAMKDWARKHGKSLLISSAEVRFPSEGAEGAMWDLYIRMAHQEWLSIRERYVRMQGFKRQQGSLVGRAPWGYSIGPGVNEYGQPIKTLVPTDDGQRFVPGIFEKVVAGESLREVAAWLDIHGVKPEGTITHQARQAAGEKCGKHCYCHGGKGIPGWNEGSLAQLIRNPVYSGTRRDADGNAVLRVEALVSVGQQEQAKARLSARARPGRSGTVQPKALLSTLKCGNPDCLAARARLQGIPEAELAARGPSTMTRIVSGKGNAATAYYRCLGRGPGRKGCKTMVRLTELDDLVTSAFEHWHDEPHRGSVYIPGDNRAQEIERLELERDELMKGRDRAERRDIFDRYDAKIAALEAEPVVQAHWKHTDTGLSVGQHFLSLDADGRRAYLAERDIRAWREDARLMVTVDGALARKGGMSALASETPMSALAA